MQMNANLTTNPGIEKLICEFMKYLRQRNVEAFLGLFYRPDAPFVFPTTLHNGQVKEYTAESFIESICDYDVDVYETMWNPQMSVNQDVATVVCDYTFHNDGQITFAGKEMWSLVNTADGWKIVSVIWNTDSLNG